MVGKSLPNWRKNMVGNLVGSGSLEKKEIFGEIWWLESPHRGNVQARR
jgi:hypothetical protein